MTNKPLSQYFTAKKKQRRQRRSHCLKVLSDAPSDVPLKVPSRIQMDNFSDLEGDFKVSFYKSDLQKKYELKDIIGDDTEGAVYKAINKKVFFLDTNLHGLPLTYCSTV